MLERALSAAQALAPGNSAATVDGAGRRAQTRSEPRKPREA